MCCPTEDGKRNMVVNVLNNGKKRSSNCLERIVLARNTNCSQVGTEPNISRIANVNSKTYKISIPGKMTNNVQLN